MSVLPVGIGSSGIDVGDIGHSLRFRGAQYLSKTLAAATDSTKGTIDIRFKPNVVASEQDLFSAYDDINNYMYVMLYSDYTMLIVWVISGTQYSAKTNRVFRSPDWITATITFDTNNATQSSRAIIKINGGAAETYSSNDLPQTTGLRFNSAHPHYIGSLGASAYFGGYMARFVFVGDQLKNPTDFGYFNTTINEWVTKSQSAVKAVVDAGGTNSFMLDFDDGTSTTTLGYDKSSKGNNWTLNNFSLTAGTSYDYMLDVPGNSFCTASPIDLGANPGSSTLTEANLKSVCAAVSGGSSTCGTQALPSGKWYWEYVPTAIGDGLILGITSRTSGSPSGTVVGYVFNGQKNVGGTGSSYGASYAANDIIGVAVDTTANTIEFFKNSASQGVITNATYIVPGCKPVHWNNSSSAGSTVQHMYGQAPLHASATYHSAAGGYFRYAPPTGYKALCQANLPDPAILNPELHFDVVTRTGATGDSTVSGLQFAPDLIWSKCRNNAINNHLQSRLLTWTGSTAWAGFLETNTTTAEQNTGGGDFQNITSSGYSIIGDNTRSDANGYTYVDWLWKAGGAAVTNNNGSISSQVSANVLAGFSIVTYTGTGANATVGHGLSKAPKMVIVKQRSSGTTENWAVYNANLANTEYLLLNGTAAKATGTTYWNSATPSTTVFSVGSAADTNENTKDYVAYCFTDIEGYSKAFSYTGNGSADGPFVHLGFKPKFVMVKRTDSTGSWQVFDSIRAGYNVDNDQLVANTSAAEVTTDLLDLTANGFKLRSTSTEVNASSGTYIFLAFADVPGKYSLAR